MATSAEIQTLFSESECTACSGTATTFQTLAIALLQQIVPMTQAEIEAESNCWLCYGVSQAEAAILVLLNNLSGGGGGGGSVIIQGQSANYGGGTPTWTPTTGFGFAWDTSTDPDTEWNYHDGAWH